MLKDRFIPAVFILATLTDCSEIKNVSPENKPILWSVSQGLCEPETIVLTPESSELIVSNICGFKKNGEGYLSKVGLDGTMIEPKWVVDLNAPAGMVASPSFLYVVDVDSVHRINYATGNIDMTMGPFEGAKAFNDIALDRDGPIYVSDSAHGHVLKIEKGKAVIFPTKDEKFAFANGLHTQEGFLYVGGEKLWRIDLETNKIDVITVDGISDIDGIEGDGSGGLIVSIVGGNLWHLPRIGRPKEWTAKGLSSTNHLFLPYRNLAIIPTGYDNTILAIEP